MRYGTLYGIGIGPGDPDLITMKGAKVLSDSRHVFVPKGKAQTESVALAIAGKHIAPGATVYEVVFPMITDEDELNRRWNASAEEVAAVLKGGDDACFLTLGDPLLYSTYIYLVRALRALFPEVEVSTIPGVTAFSAAAALTDFPVGTAKQPVVIVPTADDLKDVEKALDMGGTVVLMKIGKRLGAIVDLLAGKGLLERCVLVSRAGMAEQRIETDLSGLADTPEVGYLSIILVHAA